MLPVSDLYTRLMRGIAILKQSNGYGAPCYGEDRLYFLEGYYEPESRREAELLAKQTCYFCPLVKACGDYALAANEEAGIWGGLTPKERKNIRQKKS